MDTSSFSLVSLFYRLFGYGGGPRVISVMTILPYIKKGAKEAESVYTCIDAIEQDEAGTLVNQN